MNAPDCSQAQNYRGIPGRLHWERHQDEDRLVFGSFVYARFPALLRCPGLDDAAALCCHVGEVLDYLDRRVDAGDTEAVELLHRIETIYPEVILMAQTAATALVKGAPMNITTMLQAFKGQIAAALPKHLTADRMSRLALTVIRKNPKLLQCEPMSVFGSVLQAAQLGLEIGTHAHLVPFENKKARRLECQMIPDYRGLMHLCRRSGDVGRFEAVAVHAGDHFVYERGLNPKLEHVPRAQKLGTLTYVYAVAEGRNKSWQQFEVMTREEIEAIRKNSPGANSPAWKDHYEEMAKKTVIRRISKVLPQSVEFTRALQLADDAGAEQAQANAALFDAEFVTLEAQYPQDDEGSHGAARDGGDSSASPAGSDAAPASVSSSEQQPPAPDAKPRSLDELLAAVEVAADEESLETIRTLKDQLFNDDKRDQVAKAISARFRKLRGK